uniref:Uncharacterized protein n=1 Tax=Mesocestoides corti TaxID=53468 RepID=A0A5K3FIM5_MESCO
MLGVGECRNGYFNNHEQCGKPNQRPILCLSAFQWHSSKISDQPEKDKNEVQYIMSYVVSVVHSDGRSLTCGCDLLLVNKTMFKCTSFL